ncbi:MAG: NYN domain-containing protein [Patescibacteria group bacterium]|nr:NYN domain-containing protein [Patescibacteria group bacterium]
MRRKATKPTTFAFVDSQNLNLGTQRMGWKLDWRKFREYLRDTYNVTQAYLFIGYMSENESLYEHMHELGYLIVLKPTVDVSAMHHDPVDGEAPKKETDKDGKEKPTIKGNVDAELVLYAMKEMPNYDQAIIVSGDGDFFSLAEYLLAQNKLAHILTPNWQYSSLLKPFEDKIVRLDQKRRLLAYRDHKKK